ncbi:hypothetical protein [Adhaeribacter pallidiroseus]|uniref:Cytochrome b561 domain-containing protein n=1 Tax=Adhaeribacter pallidiroseus TaxID=2072847 RepID=A0A369QBR6_9BACT|nr:hypothetical protein [Adhaeribacter pallidiroseus]RDC62341.1 hypothetical protein AHMF7616_00934 [Adhaeribacter pallidiroseus]
MYTGLQHLHSYLAYLVLLGLIISLLNALTGWLQNRRFQDKDRKRSLLGLIPVHLQWLIGVVLYFVSPLGAANASGAAMKDATSRLYILEHPLTMIIAVILITVGYSRAKRLKTDNARFKNLVIFYGIGLILVLSRIPWQAWFAAN